MLECPTRNCGPKLQNRVACRRRKSNKRDPKRWHGRATFGTGRAKLLTWGHRIFVLNLVFFQPESAPNPLSFASRLLHPIFVPEIYFIEA